MSHSARCAAIAFRTIASTAFCAALLLLISVNPAAAQRAWFGTRPDWSSSQPDLRTYCTAVGDIDLDGDLDLVCGNYLASEPVTVYENVDGQLTHEPVWSRGYYKTYAIALGDIDGDGDLDLVCGNSGQPNALHLNTGSGFVIAPAWRSAESHYTYGIALGDMDNDGDLDLVCANFSQPNVLYENVGGVFDTVATIISSAYDKTQSIALGDVDGDGDLDVIFGNHSEPNACYMNMINMGIAFFFTQGWSCPASYYTYSVELGDIDGDGDLDLVCGNYDQPNMLYLNTGTTFEGTPAWLSDERNSTTSIAFGDLDKDGDLDLACGNYFFERPAELPQGQENTVYENAGGIFTPTPTWRSGRIDKTRSVALFDIDGNGYLDLFSANFAQPHAYYLNLLKGFAPGAIWTSAPVLNTKTVTLGDIDRDGDVDLVCGAIWDIGETHGPYLMLYENTGEGLSTNPIWEISSTLPSLNLNKVVLGDIDQDPAGDLDLACADQTSDHFHAVPAEAHENRSEITGKWFSNNPVWRSDTLGVWFNTCALGDVTGDGRLDLVCGRDSGAAKRTHVFVNNGQWFSPTPRIWGPAFHMLDLALGDVNNDRKLDAVYATNEYNALLLNTGPGFPGQPSWVSERSSCTTSIALGDLDGDDDLDLVCGNREEGVRQGANAIYENIGGTFSQTPQMKLFSETNDQTYGVALGDVDGDGDLDIVFGNSGEPSVCYDNEGGTFSYEPIWTTPQNEMMETRAVALGDIDGDGDLDLVCGNNKYPDKIYGGLKDPVFKHNPQNPTNQAGNNPAYLRRVAASKNGTNRYAVVFTAHDVESDRLWLVGHYRLALQSTWHPMVLIGGGGAQGNRVGPISASPTGVIDSLEWDVSSVPFSHQDVVVRLRLAEIPRRISNIQYAALFQLTVNKIVPRRSELTVTDMIDYSATAVTVGDTITQDMVLSNTGNLDLVINDIYLPSDEMHHGGVLPLTLAPRETYTVPVYLHPRLETDISGTIEITSNDPVAPVRTVPVDTDIRALTVTSELLTTEPELPLGEAVTIAITPLPQVHVERGWVYHRPRGATVFIDSIAIHKLEDQFLATIPGAAVRESGLEYYVKVENSGIFSTVPPGAPGDTVSYYPVASPSGLTTRPALQVLAGNNIEVIFELPIGAEFENGRIQYRQGGETAFHTGQVTYEEEAYVAIIPDSMVTCRGLEYWGEVKTLTTTLSDPWQDPDRHPRIIPVTVQNLLEPHVHSGGKEREYYRIVSIPLGFKPEFDGTIEALLTDQPEFGPYDPIRWRCWVYLPASGTYGELNDPALPGMAELFRPAPGRAYWLISRENHRVSTAPISGVSTPTVGPFAIELASGWNMVGCPFAFSVSWDSVMVDTLTMAEAEEGVMVGAPVRWAAGAYHDAPLLEPFEGYWIFNHEDHPVTLKIPPREMEESAVPILAAKVSDVDWQIVLMASSRGMKDISVKVGCATAAMPGLDRLDRMTPPPAPERGLALYSFGPKDEEKYYCYRVDMRPPPAETGEWGQVWAVDVLKQYTLEPAGDAVTIAIDSLMNVPADAAVALVDRILERRIDLRDERAYTCYLATRDYVRTEDQARFRLIVGTEAFVQEETERLIDLPTHAALYQNYPNPFNPATIIRYDVATAGPVSLRIYNVNGALVRVLEDRHRDPGRYEAGWNGENDSGNRVGSGVYFCRLVAPGYEDTKKMVLLK